MPSVADSARRASGDHRSSGLRLDGTAVGPQQGPGALRCRMGWLCWAFRVCSI